MIVIEDGSSSSLAKVDAGTIARPGAPLTVSQLEHALLKRWPAEDAMDWDRTGLLVGDPAALIEGVAVALDVTGRALEVAKRLGANVLLTHHPAYLDPPARISPAHGMASPAGFNVYSAVKEGIALVNFHTALDASLDASGVLPGLLGLDCAGVLVPTVATGDKGFGQRCTVRPQDAPFRLSHLAARCTSVFGRHPRVWGDFEAVLSSVAVTNGSAGDAVEAALNAHADCLVCGEIRYHAALDAAQAGLAVVELGHDVSELPLTAVLAQAAIEAGVPKDKVSVIDQSHNWQTPDSTRI